MSITSWIRLLTVIVGLLVPASQALSSDAVGTAVFEPADWVTRDADGVTQVRLLVFWTRTCPHCLDALQFLATLPTSAPWIEVHSFDLSAERAHVERYVALAAALGEDARSVPAFFVCGRMVTGFDDAQGVGARLLRLAHACREAASAETWDAPVDEEPAVLLPFLGSLEGANLSLPLFTLVIAGLDAFNPCAFFVLFFLLSLMVHTRSRARMLLVGGIFVLFSGLVYFVFMAAWLNLFLLIGGAGVVTTAAGIVALLIGALNVKDYFLFGRGPSLVIPEQAKPGLFTRMRGLLSADRFGALLVGTMVLALAANSYELLCTAGFPMIYTRTLTLQELPSATYYGYLALYNLIYVTPLLVIVLLFSLVLGARKLSERQGRVLKLVSGLMMLGLGCLMLIAPELLINPIFGGMLLLFAVAVAGLLALFERRMTAA
ncbi:glutaredoxin family protein [Thiocapsa imhoffii]|nr:hypothetical protein [Thiocapsa imhoffii]